ncbi:uncharacterized protein LOC143911392 [Arctopsyche grandis]|uniref:uncharacterized protein LOC143911392 n=1 Tax=Arctopsyche grandis TaxID=121162 RepID=UPI00406D9CFC
MAIRHNLILALVCIGLSATTADDCTQKRCPEEQSGVTLLPIINDCEKYIACYNGMAILKSCKDDHIFSDDLQACVPSYMITCNVCKNIEDYSESSEEDDSSEEEDNLDYYSENQAENELCKDENGMYVDLKPDPEDCTKYYVCDWGDLIHMSCPPGTIFRAAFKRCDFPEHGGCIIDNPTKSKDDIFSSKLEQVITPHENNISERCIRNSITPVSCAQTLPDDRLLVHPDDCELFYYCVTETLAPICRDCPAGLHFNPVKKVCDRPSVAGCKVFSSPEASRNNIKNRINDAIKAVAESKLDQVITPHENNISERCIRNSITPVSCAQTLPDDRLLVHPDDCELFYYCVTETLAPICRDCPAGLHFNPVKKVCDHPSVAGCKVFSSPEASRNNIKNRINDAIKAVAESKLDQVITPHENNISERCIRNSITPVSCAQTLPDDRLLVHPDDCELFYYCVTETLAPICRDCPAGLHFNPVKKVCDRPSVAGCKVFLIPKVFRNRFVNRIN